MRHRSPPFILLLLLPLVTACADHMTAPGPQQPNPRIAELLRGVPQGGPVAVAEVVGDGHSEFYLARGRTARSEQQNVVAAFRMDFDPANLTFTVRPGGGRATLNAPNTLQMTWRFYCYNWTTNQWVAQQSVRVNRARQRAVANSGGHLGGHSLPAKPVGTWNPSTSGGFISSWVSTITGGIASGDEIVTFETTVQDAGDCQGETVFEALSATRWPGLIELTGLVRAAITSNHSNVYYATPQMAQHALAAHNFHRELTGTSFSITAGALIYGGINDVNNNWGPPHSTHRIGTDLDIDGPGNTPRIFNPQIAAGRRGGFARCEVHNRNHVHCYDIQY